MRVRTSNDIVHWVRFFLSGVHATAENGRDTFQKILALRTEVEQKVHALGKRAPSARATLALLYRKPVITVAELVQATNLSKPTANALVRDLERLNILKEISGARRYRVFAFERYLGLFVS